VGRYLVILCMLFLFGCNNTNISASTEEITPTPEDYGCRLTSIDNLQAFVDFDLPRFSEPSGDAMTTRVNNIVGAYAQRDISEFGALVEMNPEQGDVQVFQRAYNVTAEYAVKRVNPDNNTQYYAHETGKFEGRCFAVTKGGMLLESGLILVRDKSNVGSDRYVLTHTWAYPDFSQALIKYKDANKPAEITNTPIPTITVSASPIPEPETKNSGAGQVFAFMIYLLILIVILYFIPWSMYAKVISMFPSMESKISKFYDVIHMKGKIDKTKGEPSDSDESGHKSE